VYGGNKKQDLWRTHFPEFMAEGGLGALMESATLVKLNAGQHVFYPGDTCEQYLLVLQDSR